MLTKHIMRTHLSSVLEVNLSSLDFNNLVRLGVFDLSSLSVEESFLKVLWAIF